MQRQSGFTLIELMITVAIIAILAGVALPSYTRYIVRGKLQEAHTNLLSMRTKMELYFQDNRSYVGACLAGTVAPLPTFPPDAPGVLKYFTISCTPAPTANAYTLQATGKASTDLDGLVLTINEGNVRRTVSVPAGWVLPSANCWVTKKGGQC